VGVPDNVAEDLTKRSDEELETAKANLLFFAAQNMLSGTSTDDLRNILRAVETEIAVRAKTSEQRVVN